jgi:hypothetical protein
MFGCPMPDRANHAMPLSALLMELADTPEPRITIGQIMETFGGRAMGGLLLIFGLACTLPLPPGGSTIFGAPLCLLAPQLLLGARAPWLPSRMRKGAIPTADLRRGLPRVLPWIRRMEAVSRPRLSFVLSPVGQRVVGLVCTLLALVLILPIPFGNMLPATAVTVLSLSLVQKDGALALFGYGLAAASVGVLALAAGILSRGAQHVFTVFGIG